MSNKLQVAADMVGVPEGCVPEFGITIVSYLGEDSESLFAYSTFGNGAHSAMIGLLAMASHSLTHEANPTPCELEDEEDDEDAV